MYRKRITERFPWLLTLRKKQRLFCFYLGLCLDRNHYAEKQLDTVLPYPLFETACPMINTETGFDTIYQENKIFNLKLASKAISKLVILPGETFSFWKSIRYADKETPYKDGLGVSDGKLQIVPGGGLCQLSNLLFWLFLHTPLTITERHGHKIKKFPEPPSDALMGVDATVYDGWLDLKVTNNTNAAFQIIISFDENNICGSIYTDTPPTEAIEIANSKPLYYQQDGKIYEEVNILQNITSLSDGKRISSKLLYRNFCEIGYHLPENIEVINRKEPK